MELKTAMHLSTNSLNERNIHYKVDKIPLKIKVMDNYIKWII